MQQFLRQSSRLLRICAAALLLALVLVVVNAFAPVFPWFVLWLPGVVSLLSVTAAFLRTNRAKHLNAPTRRFWGHLSLAAFFVCGGSVSQAIEVLTAQHVAGQHLGLGQQIFYGSALIVIMYALLRLPFGEQTRGELFRIVLDAGTVMLACSIFLWHFTTRQALHAGDQASLFASLGLTVVALLAVFALAKFMLTSHAHLDRGALRLFGVAVVIGAVAPTFRPLFEVVDPHLFPDMLDMPALCFFAVWAADYQRTRVVATRRGVQPSRPRSFSLLPYVAVAAVDGLLLAVTWRDDADQRAVVGSAVLLTGLVVLRQVTAFLDNGRLLRRLDHGATHDALTQLPNRVLFHERLNKALTTPGARPVSVALIDLDDFKEVNDTLGHEVGDLLLIAVAQRLASCLRAEDTVARLGGDEFVVVLDGADPATADLAAKRMIEALRPPVPADGHELPIRASIGIADGTSGDDPSVLLRRADIAMYAAKNIPGTASLHYNTAMATAGVDHAHLGAELRTAIDDDQLFLLFQPIVSLTDGHLLGAEALVRWAHPTHGTLAPDAFLPVAERTGLIVPLGRWVLRAALRQLAAWPARIHLNINISARDLREPDFAAVVSALLDEHEVAPDRITLEITESMAIDIPESIVNLHALRTLGVKLALDDFGTGNSTLTLLHDCPVDELKLDRSFTQAAPHPGRAPVAAAVIQLAGTLGLHVVAEGVETAEEATHLRGLGYTAAQGYHFARPMPAPTFTELLDDSLAHPVG